MFEKNIIQISLFGSLQLRMENIKRQEHCNALIISIHLPLRIDDVCALQCACACARTQQKLYKQFKRWIALEIGEVVTTHTTHMQQAMCV